MWHEVARIAFIVIVSGILGMPVFAIWYWVDTMNAKRRVREFFKYSIDTKTTN